MGGSTSPRALLVHLRDSHDPMCAHEVRCFARAARLEPASISVHALIDAPLPTAGLGRFDVVFFGGSGAYGVLDDVPWLAHAADAFRAVLDVAVPTWASCFGFQAVAKALGGTVVHDPARFEMGAVPLSITPEGAADPLTGSLPPSFWVQQGHKDHVLALPEGVTRLASGATDIEQAFRVDGAPFYASQFHPELDQQRLTERFLFYRDHYESVDPQGFRERLEAIRRGTDTPEVPALLARLARGAVA